MALRLLKSDGNQHHHLADESQMKYAMLRRTLHESPTEPVVSDVARFERERECRCFADEPTSGNARIGNQAIKYRQLWRLEWFRAMAGDLGSARIGSTCHIRN